jgi:hypothetical protein
MVYGLTRVEQDLTEHPPADVGELLRRIGHAFVDGVGGVTGIYPFLPMRLPAVTVAALAP